MFWAHILFRFIHIPGTRITFVSNEVSVPKNEHSDQFILDYYNGIYIMCFGHQLTLRTLTKDTKNYSKGLDLIFKKLSDYVKIFLPIF